MTIQEVKKVTDPEYTVVTTKRDTFKRFCSCMNYELHGKRYETHNGNLLEFFDYDTIEKLQAHVKNPGTCIWCVPQEQFTEGADIVLDLEGCLQEQWNRLHSFLGFPGEPVTIEHKNVCKEKKFTIDQLKKVYSSVYM
jgi:hypothetical protein